MLPPFLDRLTPRVYPHTRLLTAAHVWFCLGIFLACKGLYLDREASLPIIILTTIIGLTLGMLKSRYVFDKVADKIVVHIRQKPSRACLGGLFSFKNWGLIVMMMLLGRLVSTSALERDLKTGIYVMVGTGLAYSSRRLWKAWRTTPRIMLQDLRR